MPDENFQQSSLPESVGSLRELYRSSEARAARLRLLIEVGRDLASATRGNLKEILSLSARRAAYFSGNTSGHVTECTEEEGIPLITPGPDGRRVGTLVLKDTNTSPVNVSIEDKEALNLLAQLIAATIDRVAHDEERDQLLAALRERERRLEQVVDKLFSAQEDERRRVSAELHDSIAQTAGALFRRLEVRGMRSGGCSEDDKELAGIAQGLVREIRRMIAGLRPTSLDDLGLPSALSGLADSMRKEGFEVYLNAEDGENCSPILATALFRVAQEALTNVSKHSGGPCRINIDLISDPEKTVWQLKVQDFGKGFAQHANRTALPGEHLGIEMMRERMTAIGGTLDISETRAGGVIVTASVRNPILP